MGDYKDNIRRFTAEEKMKVAKVVPKMSKDLRWKLFSLTKNTSGDVRRTATKRQ